MPRLGRFARELRGRLWKPSVEEEVRREIANHLEMLQQDLIARGLDRASAHAAAREKFGDAASISDICREIGDRRDRELERSEWFAELGQDVRYALRQVRTNLRFSAIAVLTLAVGLGAMTTIFGIADVVLLRPFAVAEPDRLVIVSETSPTGQRFNVSEPDYLDWRDRSRAFAGIAAISNRALTIRTDAGPERLLAAATTHSFFPVLGVPPALGRAFSSAEDVPGSDTRVVVLAHVLWERHFGGDPGVLEQSLELDGISHRIIGVMPPDFAFPERVDVWVPLAPSPTFHRGDRRLETIARLTPGVTRAQAATELQSLARQIAVEHPDTNGDWGAQLQPFSEWFVTPQLEARVVALLATVGLLLLMACVNVASLLLARAGARQREMAVRTALGAGRARIVRQLLTESLVLSLLGAAAGIAVAAAAIPVVRGIGSVAISRLDALALDWRVLAFALGACLTTGLLFGLAPALHLVRRDSHGASASDILRSGARTIGGGGLRNTLVVTSIALAMLLLVSAGLVGASFVKLMRVQLGFTSDHVLTASIVVPSGGEDADGGARRTATFYETLLGQLRDLPGVHAAGAISIAPLSGGNTVMGFEQEELASGLEGEYRMASWRVVTPGLFEALDIPLIGGRLFDDGDRQPAPYVMLINETMARLGWPDADPVGRQARLASGLTMTIVGVVGDTRHLFADSLPPPTMYFPHGQFTNRAMWLTMRTSGEPASILGAVRREVAALDPGIPLTRAQPLTQLVRDTTAEPRLTVLVFGIFAWAALVLAAIGLYGIVSYTVTQRTREIGVRLALGAPPGRIVRAVLGQGLRLAVLGVALGGVAAFGAAGGLRTILFETEPTDAATFLVIAAMLVVVAAVASAAPALRAARVDPLVALRSE
jgi:predicted permease